jgi:hypothetical protein
MSTVMNKGIVIAIIISVILGSMIGLSLSYLTFQPSMNQLQKAYVSASLKDDRLSNSVSHNVIGTVINFGSVTASNITITVKWFKLGASFHQEIITINSLAGRAMKDISFSYTFGGSADDFQHSITWN